MRDHPFADSLVRQKGIKSPPGYKTSISICRKFLNEHAPKKAEGETVGKLDSKPVSPAQMLYAKKITQGKASSFPRRPRPLGCLSAWIDRTEARSAASAVARPPTSRRDQLRLNRRRRRRGFGDVKSPLPLPGSRAAKFGYRYAAADSLWQQGGRSEARRPLSLGWMVCPTWS